MTRPGNSTARRLSEADLYDSDYFEWTQRTARLLRAGRLGGIDVQHAAEEIEDMGKRDLREVNSRLQVVLAHLLKWKYQPRRRSASWRSTLVAQRLEIDAVLQDSPGLRRRMQENLSRTYQGAVRRAAAETGLAQATFPRSCPFSLEQVLDVDFLPAGS